MKATFASGIILIALCGMAQAAADEHDMSGHQMAVQKAATYEGIGVLKAINAQAGKMQIAHEPIVSLNWPAMTMWFALHDPLPQDIKVGDTVKFELMQGDKHQWMIVRIVRR